MTAQEKQLLDAIKAKPHHQVFPFSLGGGVKVVITRPDGVRLESVWLGRRLTIETMQRILAA